MRGAVITRTSIVHGSRSVMKLDGLAISKYFKDTSSTTYITLLSASLSSSSNVSIAAFWSDAILKRYEVC